MQERAQKAQDLSFDTFKSPEEEVTFLREKIASKEREHLERNAEADAADYETVAREEIKEYGEFTPDAVLQKLDGQAVKAAPKIVIE